MPLTPKEPVYFLLVDDLEENLLSLDALLRRDGLVLLKARSGAEALELLLKHDVALALLDVQMPEMDGFELAELMRGNSRSRRVPIIFLTAGNADHQRRFRGYEAGAVDFLHKPIETDVLRSKADVFFELYLQRAKLKRAVEENGRLLAESRSYAEALKAADRRKDEFLANMSHEIRTPMNAVVGLSNILMRDPSLSPKQQKWVETLQLSAQSLMTLINDLLDIAKIESEHVELEEVPVDFSALLREIVEISSVKATDKNIPIKLEMGEGLDTPYLGDPTRLKQVLMNLLSNAVKFTERGAVTVRATLLHEEKPALCISVADTGIGIPLEKRESIFSKFSQADSSITRKYGGTGLGLPISKHLVELMGGRIALDSTMGSGSIFTVMLPLEKSSASAPIVEAAPLISTPASAEKPLHILLVEDYMPNVLVAGTLLETLGFSYDVAQNGEEAIAKIGNGHYHLALMDVQMPQMDGLTAARHIRAAEAESGKPRTPIIGVTAFALTGDREKCIAAGMDDYISKPYDPANLHQKILQHIRAA